MNKYFYHLFVVLIFILSLTGCDKVQPTQKNSATLLFFNEFENDVEPYQTRLIVTQSFLRFDDGEGSKDFILYDREKKTIYSVNSDEQTVMSIAEKQTNVKPPFELNLGEEWLPIEEDAPKIDGMEARHYRFLVNNKNCYDVIAVEGLMPEVVMALKEFNKVLASDSALTLHTLPADMLNACDLSMDTFAVGRHLDKGFPIQEWTESGTGRHLVDYNGNFKPADSLFELPKEFQLYSVQDFREGNVSFE
jgi:hypothetical protein